MHNVVGVEIGEAGGVRGTIRRGVLYIRAASPYDFSSATAAARSVSPCSLRRRYHRI
jgi:hypothetical protein